MATRLETSPWADAHSPSVQDIGKLAEQAYRSLPGDFRALCGDLVVQVAEFASDEIIDELGGQSPYDLLGLFHPAGTLDDTGGSDSQMNVTHSVVLYRRAILDYWAEFEEPLGAIVTHILVNEIGRQYGLSDDDLEKIEIEAASEAERDARSLMQ
ncbi:MAG TPA: Zn-dependent protease [Rhizobiales bacterium]|nr:Zn-dependent protease [Hyphomicrobiales bacterium]